MKREPDICMNSVASLPRFHGAPPSFWHTVPGAWTTVQCPSKVLMMGRSGLGYRTSLGPS